MRIVFFGTDDITLPTFSALLKSDDHEILAVVSQPDRPAGRGRKLRKPVIVDIAQKAGIDLLQRENLKGRLTRRKINSLGQDINIVFAYGCYLPSVIFDNPEYRSINIHPSLLPCHRGPDPIRAALSCGDTRTGVSIQYIEKQMDTGDILSSREVEINEDETYDELCGRLSILSTDLLLSTLDKLKRKMITPVPQDESLASICCKWQKADTVIDWNDHGRDIHNMVRAFSSTPGTRTMFRGKPIIILKTKFDEAAGTDAHPGAIIHIGKRELLVSVKGGNLLLFELKPEGKNVMDIISFINGFRPTTEERFG